MYSFCSNIQKHTHTHTHAHKHALTDRHTHTRIRTRMHTHMHTHTCTQKHPIHETKFPVVSQASALFQSLPSRCRRSLNITVASEVASTCIASKLQALQGPYMQGMYTLRIASQQVAVGELLEATLAKMYSLHDKKVQMQAVCSVHHLTAYKASPNNNAGGACERKGRCMLCLARISSCQLPL